MTEQQIETTADKVVVAYGVLRAKMAEATGHDPAENPEALLQAACTVVLATEVSEVGFEVRAK